MKKTYMNGFGEDVGTSLIPLSSAVNNTTPGASILESMNIAEPGDVGMKLVDQYTTAGLKKLEMVTQAANLKSLTSERIKTLLAALGLYQMYSFLRKNPTKTILWGGIGFLLIANREKILGTSSVTPSVAVTPAVVTPTGNIVSVPLSDIKTSV